MLQTLQRKLKNKKGFTLIELIVVIAIIAILAAVLIPRFTGFTESARKKSTMSDARNIFVALEAADAEGKLTATTSAADAETIVETYTGKNIINCTGTLDADGESTITDVTKGATGLTFTYAKRIGATTYSVAVLNSVFPADAT